MYKIKQEPEDFIVKEISIVPLKETGEYSYFLLKKKNYSTVRAIQHIAQALRIKPKLIGFAGNKDKIAITEQVISIYLGKKERVEDIRLRDIELEFLGKGDNPISLGDLEGNSFEIKVRDLSEQEIENLNQKIKSRYILVPNLFGEQRFSSNNEKVGKAIVKGNFKEAVNLVLENKGDFEKEIKEYLKNSPNNYIGAINLIPFKTRKIYVHAYQSYLFNKTIKKYIEKKRTQMEIPIIGFGTEITDSELKEITSNLLEKEEVTPRDFIIKQMPDLSAEGGSRDLFFEVMDLETEQQDNIITLRFNLKKGCYATVAVEFLFSKN